MPILRSESRLGRLHLTRAVVAAVVGLLVLPPTARGAWTFWGTSDGLIDDRVTSLDLDRDGALWVGTVAGVSRYDGASWRSFGAAQGLASGDVAQVLKDRSGVVWAVTNAGLHRSTDGLRFDPAEPAIFASRQVLEDRDGVLWFATNSGLYRLEGSTLTRFTSADGLASDLVLLLYQDETGPLWVATYGGVSRRDPGAWRTYTRADGLVSDEVTTIFRDPSGVMWFGTSNGVSRFDGSAWQSYRASDGLALGTVVSIAEDRDGVLWFATPGGGISRFDGTAWRTFTIADGLPNNGGDGLFLDRFGDLWTWSSTGAARWGGVRWHVLEGAARPEGLEAVREDRSGGLWLAWYNVGIGRNDRSSWRTYSAGDGLVGSDPFAIEEERSGALWFSFSYAGHGVTRFVDGVWRNFTMADGLAGDLVFRAYQDRSGWTWFSTDQGVSRFDGARWESFTQAGGANLYGRFDHIIEDRAGALWLGGDNPVVVRFDGSTWADYPMPGSVSAIAVDSLGAVWVGYRNSPIGNDPRTGGVMRFDGSGWADIPVPGWVTCLVVDRAGALWVGWDHGVLRHESGAWTAYSSAEGVPQGAECIHAARSGEIWVGTDTGELGRFDGQAWTTITTADGFLGGAVRQILEDPDGHLWFATEIGIARFDGTEWGSYGVADGLPNPEVYVAHLARDGALWVGTFGGATRHEPDYVPPDVVFTTRPAPVSPSRFQNAGFVAAFLDTRGTRYSFSFDGAPWSPWSFEYLWSESDLAAGSHVLRVRARDQIGNVDPVPAEALFEVDPNPPTPIIRAPSFGQAIGDSITIAGTAADARFRDYRVAVRPAGQASWDPPGATILGTSSTAVADGALAGWNTRAVPDGPYEIQLSVRDTLGLQGAASVSVVVDNEEPHASVTSPARVGAESGGHVYTTGAEVHLYFPPHALDQDAVVTIDPVADADVPATLPDGAQRVHPGYAIRWVGATLLKPGTLELSYSSTPSPHAGLALYHDPGSGSWQRVGGTIEPASSMVATPLQGEGRYALFTGLVAGGGGSRLSAASLTPRVFSPTGGFADRRIGIGFTLGQAATVTVKVFNRAGRLAREVVRGEAMGPGANVVWWDGTNEGGAVVRDGIYVVSVEALGERLTRTLAVVR